MAKLNKVEVTHKLEGTNSKQDFSDSEGDPNHIDETGDSNSSSNESFERHIIIMNYVNVPMIVLQVVTQKMSQM
jgi:hypothetical protein